MKKNILILSLFCMSVFGCKNEDKTNKKLNVVTTTTMITDVVKNIGGDEIVLQGLMGSGVDPHLYKASEGDVTKLVNADVIFYNGLHLEGKLVEVFEKMERNDITQVALGELLDKSKLISSDYFASNYDPHVWFNIDYFKQYAKAITKTLSEKKPEHKDYFKQNETRYIKALEKLKENISKRINELHEAQRILVTAHDAFNYFGQAYNFEVVGLQGLSTATEAGVKDVRKLAEFIIDKKIKAIFVESSVPKRTIEALVAAVKAKDHEVKIGGTLYSDALGDSGTEEGTYIGMYSHNVKTIVNALK